MGSKAPYVAGPSHRAHGTSSGALDAEPRGARSGRMPSNGSSGGWVVDPAFGELDNEAHGERLGISSRFNLAPQSLGIEDAALVLERDARGGRGRLSSRGSLTPHHDDAALGAYYGP